jgi:hypothetical protein
MAIYKKCTASRITSSVAAMHNLGRYYQYSSVDYDLMKHYYLMTIDKGAKRPCEVSCAVLCASAMYYLGCHYQIKEKNYDLMKKYYLLAIDKGNKNAMNYLGCYYKYIEENYNLAKKYLLMAIENGGTFQYQFCPCYALFLSNINDIQNYLYAIIKGNIGLRNADVYDYKENEYLMVKYHTIDIFCNIINEHINLNIDDFDVCIHKIIDYIFASNEQYKLKNIIDKFMRYACKLYYSRNKKKKKGQIENKNELQKKYRIRIKKILNSNAQISQLFMEYLDHYYYKYLDEKYAPNGKGYMKTKKHFELMTDAITNKK